MGGGGIYSLVTLVTLIFSGYGGSGCDVYPLGGCEKGAGGPGYAEVGSGLLSGCAGYPLGCGWPG